VNNLTDAVSALSTTQGPWMCVERGGPAQARAAALLAWDGLPLLVPDPALFAARHLGVGPGLIRHEPLPVDAPDGLSPHLPPAARVVGVPEGIFGPALLGEAADPAAVCAAWGVDLAPDGPAVDAGCGLGVMARRMALAVAAGEREGPVLAFDRAPAMVRLARSSVHDSASVAFAPRSRRELAPFGPALPPLPAGAVEWAVGDALRPPLLPGSVAWLHIGNLLDMVPEGPAAVLSALTPALMPGGLLTLSTPFDEEAAPLPGGGPDPVAELSAALREAGLHEVTSQDPVPWLIREYDRGWRILLCRCVAARLPLRPSGARGRR
jgi:SAM-dependent methyltransferase